MEREGVRGEITKVQITQNGVEKIVQIEGRIIKARMASGHREGGRREKEGKNILFMLTGKPRRIGGMSQVNEGCGQRGRRGRGDERGLETFGFLDIWSPGSPSDSCGPRNGEDLIPLTAEEARHGGC